MPSKDKESSRYEYVRVRRGKEKDRDRDRDARSVSSESTVTTLKDRKQQHQRHSHNSGHGSVEASCKGSNCSLQDVALDQLPPLPETEESESASSTNGSPIVRTDSDTSVSTSQSSQPSIKTSAALQPYLENDLDETHFNHDQDAFFNAEEWIGPYETHELTRSDFLDSSTSTPKGKTISDPFEPPQAVRFELPPKSAPHKGKASDNGSKHTLNTKGHGHSKREDSQTLLRTVRQYDPNHPMNPFLHTVPTPFDTPDPSETTKLRQSNMKSSEREVLHNPERSIARRSSNLDRRVDKRESQRSSPPMTVSKPSKAVPLPQTQVPPPAPMLPQHGPPQSELSAASSQDWHSPTALPVSMYQPPPPPMQYPSIPTDPAHFMHRIGSVLPDIAAILDLYQHACSALMARDQHIAELQAQKAARDARIDKLTGEIEQVLDEHADKVQKLRADAGHWEERHKSLQKKHAEELKRKQDLEGQHEKLKNVHRNTLQAHEEQCAKMNEEHAQEKEVIKSLYASEKQDAAEQIRGEMQQALDNRVKHLEEQHEQHTAELEQQFTHRQARTEDTHRQTCSDLVDKIHQRDAQEAVWAQERAALIKKIDAQQKQLDAYEEEYDTETVHDANDDNDNNSKNHDDSRPDLMDGFDSSVESTPTPSQADRSDTTPSEVTSRRHSSSTADNGGKSVLQRVHSQRHQHQHQRHTAEKEKEKYRGRPASVYLDSRGDAVCI